MYCKKNGRVIRSKNLAIMGFWMVGEASVRSFRMKPEDFELVTTAAARLDVYPSTFIREAALMRARIAGGTGGQTEVSEKTQAIMTAEQERLAKGLLVNLRGSRGLLNQIARVLNIYAKSGKGDLPSSDECLAAIASVDAATREIEKKVSEWGGDV